MAEDLSLKVYAINMQEINQETASKVDFFSRNRVIRKLDGTSEMMK